MSFINRLITMRHKKHFQLFYDYLIKRKTPEPISSFHIICQQATQVSAIGTKFFLSKKYHIIKRMLKMRSYHYPVQYMCRQWQFLDLNLLLRPPILIPRFETEQMLVMFKQHQRFIQKVSQIKQQAKTFRFLELGSGSGAIGLALSKYFKDSGITFAAEMIDIDQRAVGLSLRNLKKNNLSKQKICIKQEDMIKLMNEKDSSYFEKFDLIISNPPYISVKEYKQSVEKQVKSYQSILALVGDEEVNKNGLYYLQRIIETVKKCHNQKYPMVVIEFGGEDLSHLGKQIQESVQNDYYGKRRFLFWFN